MDRPARRVTPDRERNRLADTATFVRTYLAAISNGATGPRLAAFFDPEIVQEEFPNRLAPAGATRNLADILEAAERGKKVMKSQVYDVKTFMAGGDRVALEVVWTGTLAAAVGTLQAGDEMKARLAMFLELRNGKIFRQRNYDCFDAF